ncbi:hypothetical protein [Duganella sp. Root1480D1]|uniref:hypothetical protein n=1 Tax=Duganella sp. Root1480D1 TaxID=1736471 RepID=UPI0007090DDB|nr:hypothetical protein [Duganella sp. Root1480D1]KQZ40923.1 hypothetical protein ASD58_26515 [Duganella sp. Root1480D1]
MKAKFIAAALLAVALAACGGKASFAIGGTISGLSNNGLILQNNGGDDLAVNAGATTFSFPNSISYGTEYKVTIKQQPEHMTCAVIGTSNIGSAGHTTSINVGITCVQNSYTLGGTVQHLTTDGLVLVNGSTSGGITVAKGATSFVVPGSIPVGTAYGVTVLTQPTGQTCSVANGSGVMGDADRANIVVSCTP